MANNEEIPPLQDNINLLAEQPPQEPPPADHDQGIDPNDGNNDVEQEEDVPIVAPFLMNVHPPQMIIKESPILPFPLHEVCS